MGQKQIYFLVITLKSGEGRVGKSRSTGPSSTSLLDVGLLLAASALEVVLLGCFELIRGDLISSTTGRFEFLVDRGAMRKRSKKPTVTAIKQPKTLIKKPK